MEEEKKITKIVISKEDELTDVISAILEAKNERIVLTFAEDTDLLISPINLKVILETADENEKALIAQIIKNPTGLRNARLANIYTIDSPGFPKEEDWIKEEENLVKRLAPPKKKVLPKEEQKDEKTIDDKTNFQKRVDDTIEKSKQYKKETQEEPLIAIDEDLPISRIEEDPVHKGEVEKQTKKDSLEKKDLSKVDFRERTKDPIKSKPSKKKVGLNIDFDSIADNVKSFFSKIKIPFPNKYKKKLPFVAFVFIALTFLVGLIYINTAILVKVKVYVEAKEVEIEEIFEGDENIKEIDFEELKIPVKTEDVEKSTSTTIKATGTGYRGEKATGEVNVTYIREDCGEDTPALEIPAGQTLSTEGKTYAIDNSFSIECNAPPSVQTITAIEVGEEYNIASGKLFTFQGYSGSQLFALNNSGAISGGSKEEYTILSKADVDTAVEDLTEIAVEEGETELQDKSGTWKIMEDSIICDIDSDSINTSVAIGAEASNVDVSIKADCSASYFLNDGFDEGISEMLTDEAEEQNLFETDKDWTLELDEEIEKEISIVESNSENIKIKIVAKSSVKPKVTKQEVLDGLEGKSWEEGNDYLQSLDFSDKETRIEFVPENFPDNFKYFPKRQGGVLIEILDAV